MKKAIAEFVGTFFLVFLGCGAAVVAGGDIGYTGISFAFGLGLIAAAYGIGPISGCHINPAVSLGVFIAGRMSVNDLIYYVAAQMAGALAAAIVLSLVASGAPGYDIAVNGLGQNGWGPGYLGEYTLISAFLFEVVATCLFVITILGATQSGAPAAMAGLVIGLALVAIHLIGIPITGTSVNPARSFGPAVMVGGQALMQLWLFIIAPLIGAALAGLLFRSRQLEAEPAADHDAA